MKKKIKSITVLSMLLFAGSLCFSQTTKECYYLEDTVGAIVEKMTATIQATGEKVKAEYVLEKSSTGNAKNTTTNKKEGLQSGNTITLQAPEMSDLIRQKMISKGITPPAEQETWTLQDNRTKLVIGTKTLIKIDCP